MSRFLVLLGGALLVTPRLRAQARGARVIAADSGIRHAAALGLVPELWVGDFDSAGSADAERYRGVARKSFPAAKDCTDGELAVDEALAAGASGIVMAGAFGGSRPDHAFAHMTAALRLAEAGVAAVLSSGREEAVPLRAGAGPARFDHAEDTLFSVLAFSPLAGLSIAGARWPLDRAAVALGSSRTISNEVRGGPLAVTLEEGRALLLAYPLPDA